MAQKTITVLLPDGTPIEDVPLNVTKSQLAAMLYTKRPDVFKRQIAVDPTWQNYMPTAALQTAAAANTGVPGEKVATVLDKALPLIGGAAGGTLGSAGGPAGSIAGATLGGGAGKALQGLLNRATGVGSYPKTSGEAAKEIGISGGEQGALQGAGELMTPLARPVGDYAQNLYARALSSTKLGAKAGLGPTLREVVPQMINNGEWAMTRTRLEDQIAQSLDEASSAFDKAVISLRNGGKMPDKQAIYDALDTYKDRFMQETPYEVEIPAKATGVVGPDGKMLMTQPTKQLVKKAAANAQGVTRYIDKLKAEIEHADSPGALNKAKKQFYAFVRNNDPFKFPISGATLTKREANRVAGNAIARQIGKANPEMAEASKQFHYAKSKSDLLELAKLQRLGRQGSYRPVINAMVGGDVAGLPGAAAGLVASKIGTSTPLRTGGGILLDRLSQLLGNPLFARAVADAVRAGQFAANSQ